MNKADMILKNGNVLSVKADDEVIRGQAVAISDGRIMAVGSDEEILKYADEGTEIIDCKGNTILPGMCDAHCHPAIASANASGVQMFGVYKQEGQSEDDVIDTYIEQVRKFIEDHPDDRIIRGSGWVISNFYGSDRYPTRHDLDKICSDRPIILESFCQHNLWVNTKAIEEAGVNAETPDVQSGKIFREEGGYPQGVFNDPEAMAYIKEGVPGYTMSVEEYKRALLWYQRECANRYGVTFVQDCMLSENAIEAYRQLAEEGKLTMRARAVYQLEPKEYDKQLSEYISRKGKDNVGNDFRIDTIKVFAEGFMVMLEPYEEEYAKQMGIEETGNYEGYWQDNILTDCAAKAMEAGFNVHIHAMGDGSVHQSVECLAEAQKITGKEPGNIVAHLTLVDQKDIETMAESKIIANCQPRWMIFDGDIHAQEAMFGSERNSKCYPFRRFIDAGVTVAFGTDFPVTPPPDTMHEIQCAMTRTIFPDALGYEDYKGRVLGDEIPATLEECVKSLTINGAFQMLLDDETGSIEVGKSAELVVLDSNIENTPKNQIYKIKVMKTIFKGKVVFEQ